MNVPIQEWGVRLSDALRNVLSVSRKPDYEKARVLAVEGDGQTQSLAKEFTFMVRGLEMTIGVILDLLKDTAKEQDASSVSELIGLIYQFRTNLRFLQGSTTQPQVRLAEEITLTVTTLSEVRQWFGQEQNQLATEIINAIDEKDSQKALALIDKKELKQYLSLHDLLVRFMADSFSWVYRCYGSEALLEFHMKTADGQRAGFEKWDQLPPEEFARVTSFLLKQHMGQVSVTEDSEKFIITQSPCGSGGRFNLDGAYEGTEDLPVITEKGPLTFDQEKIPVYCSHCAIWNGTAPIEWFGYPQWVFKEPARKDGGCIMHIYKQPENAPEEYRQKVSLIKTQTGNDHD